MTRRRRPLIDRIGDKVATDDNGCLLWLGSVDGDGYGRVRSAAGPLVGPHHVLYEDAIGPIPPGLQTDHLCRVRACCLPAHLEPVTHAVNNHRRALAQTTCKLDHPLPPARPGVTRVCAICVRVTNRERMRAYRARKALGGAA